MTTRERIIIGVTGVSLLWAGGTFLWDRRAAKSESETGPHASSEAVLVMAQAREQLEMNRVTAAERYILEASSADWTDAQRSEQTVGEAEGAQGPSVYLYSGFIQAGDTSFAILNGREYGVNDVLVDGECVVAAIEPDHVVLLFRRENRQQTVLFQNAVIKRE